MALLRTGIPTYLLQYDKRRLATLENSRSNSSLLKLSDLITLIDKLISASDQDRLALLDSIQLSYICRNLAPDYFNGSLEQIIKRTCEMASRCCRGCFKYNPGSIGTCWYEICDTIYNSDTSYHCNQYDWSDFESPACSREQHFSKIHKIFRLLGAETVFDLYEPYNKLAKADESVRGQDSRGFVIATNPSSRGKNSASDKTNLFI